MRQFPLPAESLIELNFRHSSESVNVESRGGNSKGFPRVATASSQGDWHGRSMESSLLPPTITYLERVWVSARIAASATSNRLATAFILSSSFDHPSSIIAICLTLYIVANDNNRASAMFIRNNSTRRNRRWRCCHCCLVCCRVSNEPPARSCYLI